MTNEALLALALAAIDDADARVVFQDAKEEAGWWPPALDDFGWSWWNYASDGRSANPTVRRFTAYAAVLLFGSWPTSWPLAERCRVETELDRWWIDQQSIRRSDD